MIFLCKVPTPLSQLSIDNFPEEAEWNVLESEFAAAIRKTQGDQAPCPDHVRAEHLNYLHEFLTRPLAYTFTVILVSEMVPKDCLGSETVLLHKKAPRDKLANYLPISISSVVLKVFSRLILNRISGILSTNTR